MLLQVESYMSYLINIDLKRTGECRFHVTDRIPITEPYTFGLEKGNKFNQLFSEKYCNVFAQMHDHNPFNCLGCSTYGKQV